MGILMGCFVPNTTTFLAFPAMFPLRTFPSDLLWISFLGKKRKKGRIGSAFIIPIIVAGVVVVRKVQAFSGLLASRMTLPNTFLATVMAFERRVS